jgi:hypothetical protein
MTLKIFGDFFLIEVLLEKIDMFRKLGEIERNQDPEEETRRPSIIFIWVC